MAWGSLLSWSWFGQTRYAWSSGAADCSRRQRVPSRPSLRRCGSRPMNVFGIAGWSNAGKTTLVERLVPLLVANLLNQRIRARGVFRAVFFAPML